MQTMMTGVFIGIVVGMVIMWAIENHDTVAGWIAALKKTKGP